MDPDESRSWVLIADSLPGRTPEGCRSRLKIVKTSEEGVSNPAASVDKEEKQGNVPFSK